MKKENLMQYVLLVLIALIVLIGLVNSFMTSRDLKEAAKSLKEASKKVDESIFLIKDQGIIIDSIKGSNVKLLNDIVKMQTVNDQIKGSLNYKFIKAFDYLNSLGIKIDTINNRIE